MTQDPQIIAFYSHKGGVGRSLSLANTAIALAKKGKKVLMLDFDLEAPGLHEISPFREVVAPAPYGLIELLSLYTATSDDEKNRTSFPKWILEEYATPVTIRHAKKEDSSGVGNLWIIPASNSLWGNGEGPGDLNHEKKRKTYLDALNHFSWENFYSSAGDAAWADILARLTSKDEPNGYGFDFILIDSRTGFSDPFYVAMTLAKTIVIVSGFNRQNIKGTKELVGRLKSDGFIEQYGRKRCILVGSPEPELADSERRKWLTEVQTICSWPDFKGFQIRLPYIPRLALGEETIVDSIGPTSPAREKDYAQNIGQLAEKLLEKYITPIDSPSVKTATPTNPFVLLRADYANHEQIGQYFIDPGKELVRAMSTFMPVIFQGARGSGKTMLGRYFSVERIAGAIRQKGVVPSPDLAPTYLGLYLRIDIDLLQVFVPATRDKQGHYNMLFSQFFDLLVLRKALHAFDEFGGLAVWCESADREKKLYQVLIREFGPEYRNIDPTMDALLIAIEDRLASMRYYVNNPENTPEPARLQSNILLKLLVEQLTESPDSKFGKHYFAVILDEYEHYTEDQQKVVNSRIKQIKESDHVTYRLLCKHGKAGLRTTATLADGQQIQPIHDFNLVNLDESIDTIQFTGHLQNIAQKYLENNDFFSLLGVTTLDELLATETASDQARRIAHTKQDKPLRDWISKFFPADMAGIFAWFDREPNILTKALGVVIMNQGRLRKREGSGKDPDSVIYEIENNTSKAKDWRHNYERGTLFWLARLYSRPQAVMYAGTETVSLLSGRNVRTFLELCRSIVEEWFASPRKGETAAPPISVSIQTDALRKAADGYRGVIRSLPKYSRELLDFTDRLGQLLAVMNRTPTQSEPEINHFSVTKDTEINEVWTDLFQAAYAESILLRLPGNKQKSDADLQLDDWQLNPCFAPHYGFSPRRKKKLGTLSGEELRILFMGSQAEYAALQRQYLNAVNSGFDSSSQERLL
ncbi:MinD/ParA family ATP-binding protein [Noviherbaspirillum pedocola]|uniref:AAA family ATPase n=1 Tax=Noviherbaspirillum pedocola TaxID=2801341 RepID=A0A934W8Q4_9BURK|nr:AAA family ATPase [Noviherbaspirillum pedocola]MBK4738927.1 AAA family ATPase [Noviherbaspirillum pedocola]